MNRFIFFLLPLLWMMACREAKVEVKPAAATFIDTLPGSCPNLTKDAKGNVILSWVRKRADSTEIFCYATSTDGGQTFGEPVLVTPSVTIKPHAENLPKMLFKPSGEIMAVWGTESNSTKNKYAGNIWYAKSFDGGKTWSSAQPLVTDTAGYDQRYFDVALQPDGEAAIIWLDNRKTITQEGSALFFAVARGKEGFKGEKRIMQPTCQCCRTKLFIDSKNNMHAAFRGILQDSIRDMMHTVSTDGGQTFSTPRRINEDNWAIKACPHTGPAMTENREGLHFTWSTGSKKEGTLHTHSSDGGSSFAPATTISPKGKHPQMTTTTDGTIATAWDESVKTGDLTFTRVGLQLTGTNGKKVYKGFLSPEGENASYPVMTLAAEQQLVLAYNQKKGGKNYIAYQRVPLSK